MKKDKNKVSNSDLGFSCVFQNHSLCLKKLVWLRLDMSQGDVLNIFPSLVYCFNFAQDIFLGKESINLEGKILWIFIC